MEVAQSPLKFFEGKLSRLVFKDGDQLCAKVGMVLSVGPIFLELETHHNRYLIRQDQVLKISLAEGRP